MSNVVQVLRDRGLLEAMTSEEIEKLAEKPLCVYLGFDPSADSLHLGNLLGIVVLKWFEKFGHTPYVLLGGATGRIGDPSGKSIERPLLDDSTIRHNVASIKKHFDKILQRFEMVNNDDWLGKLNLIDFLRDVGKYFRVNTMLTKDSVRSRLESEEGISFTEFSYQLLQAYDFYHLYTDQNVIMQLGGIDQWGNIVAGIDLIRKIAGKPAYGLTWPLLTRSDGKKFGKSEEGAIWLAPEKCSPYQFYQHLVRMPDADVIKLMKMLTFMDLAEIREWEIKMGLPDYVPNSAQRRFAEEVTKLVHGEEGLAAAIRVTDAAAPGSKGQLNVEVLTEIAADMPHVTYPLSDVIGKKFVDILVKTEILASKGEAVRLIKNGGAYLNEEKVIDPNLIIEKNALIGSNMLLVGIGKKKKILIKLLPENE